MLMFQMLQGTLSEVRFRWPDQDQDQEQHHGDQDEEGRPLEEISRTDLRLNDVCYINGQSTCMFTPKKRYG